MGCGAGRGEAGRGVEEAARLGATFPWDPRPSSPTSKTFPSGSKGLRLRPAPLPTTRGLGLGAQELVDFAEGEPAGRECGRGEEVGARPSPEPRLARGSWAASPLPELGARGQGSCEAPPSPEACQLDGRVCNGWGGGQDKSALGQPLPGP